MNYYLDQLITKKIPSKRNPIVIGIKQKSTIKENIDDDDYDLDKDDEKVNVEIINDSDDLDETEKKEPQLQILDKRETSNINRQLILDRIKKKNFFTNDDKLPQQLDSDSDNDDNINFEDNNLNLPVSDDEQPNKGSDSQDEIIEEKQEKIIIKKKSKKDIGDITLPTVKSSKRAKPKVISTMNIDDAIIGSKKVSDRIPSLKEQIKVRISPYYMNNRKISIEKINKLFSPYKKELEDASEITCENRKNNKDKLFTHQKVIKDYLNLYTPYRGLLLMHGLGSGKTCGSIAIAEGMKSDRKIILMTPKSLKMNYFTQLKECGDVLYKKNQFWEFISVDGEPEYEDILSSSLSLPKSFIKKYKGAWFVDLNKPSNFKDLTDSQQKIIDEQINEMIRSKYIDINYNGLTKNVIDSFTNNMTINPFDNSVVVVDEAHNFVSTIVNNIKSKKGFHRIFYELIMSASNIKVVLLTGTPIINYPNEIGVLFNLLRGYTKTWTFPLTINTSKKINRDFFIDLFESHHFKTYDYLEYSGNKLIITRNPFGFINTKRKSKKAETLFDEYQGVKLDDSGNISDSEFQKIIIKILEKEDISVAEKAIKIDNFKALPDDSDSFINMFVNSDEIIIKNENLFKKRILGLTSYFKSAQENLLPKLIPSEEDPVFHIIACEMSDFQFSSYEKIRKSEREQEKKNRINQKKNNANQLFKVANNYRVYSRCSCNFAFPIPPGRPMQQGKKQITESTIDGTADDYDEEPIDQDNEYSNKIQHALNFLEENADEYLSPDGLSTYSPKFLEVLSNVKNKENVGLHLIYTQFRQLEGVAILKLVLEQNGFVQFKIQKDNDIWSISPSEDPDYSTKPKFFLYTGTESDEEKEILRNIYNSEWDFVPTSLASELKNISDNNHFGEIVKIMMITKSGSEGIDLKNTRFVHIIEPYWNIIRLEQVVGRARRICSHQDLPEEFRTVQVFLYLSTFSDQQVSNTDKNKELLNNDVSKLDKKTPITTDENLFEISRIKDRLNKQILKSIKETSIDCSLYANNEDLVCFNFGKITSNQFGSFPSIEEDEQTKDEGKKTKLKLQKITSKGVEYAIDSNNNVYDINDYKKSLKNPEHLLSPIGTLVKEGRRNVINFSK